MIKNKMFVGERIYNVIEKHEKKRIIYLWHYKRYRRTYKKLLFLRKRHPKRHDKEYIIFRNKYNRVYNIIKINRLKMRTRK